jgi:excisionase family DNA binding protein
MSRERSNKAGAHQRAPCQILQEGKTALKAQDLAQLFGVTQQHIYKLAATGVIPSFRVGCAVRFDPSVVALAQEKNIRLWEQDKAQRG